MLPVPDVFDSHQHPDMVVFISQVVVRLLASAIFGGAIGLERELRHRPAGLRTNMFICFGAALFTILGDKLTSNVGPTGDHTRIAAQIITGIGFIGAGSILHEKGSVTGLTTAATVFVVAAIGMACGGGLFLVAFFSSCILLLALSVLGVWEERQGYKPITMTYAAEGTTSEVVVGEVNSILERVRLPMRWCKVGQINGIYRVVFGVEATRSQHEMIMKLLQISTAVKHFNSISVTEQE
jgi:putative Mg2+ transporter-C (MgtC) family protein